MNIKDNLSHEEEEYVRQLIEHIRGDSDIYGLIRYGSSVTSTSYRDIDLCLVAADEVPVEKQYKLRVFLPEKFDVHFFTNLPLYIQHEVLQIGVYEFIQDYDKLFDVCVKSIKDYALFEPHFRMFLELIKND